MFRSFQENKAELAVNPHPLGLEATVLGPEPGVEQGEGLVVDGVLG